MGVQVGATQIGDAQRGATGLARIQSGADTVWPTSTGIPAFSSYNFDEAGLTALDHSGTRDVALASLAQRSADAKNGTGAATAGLVLAGGSSGVAVADYNALLSRSITAWVKRPLGESGVWSVRLQVTAFDSGAFGVYEAGGNVNARFRKGGTNFNATVAALAAGDYHHYAVTYDATTGTGSLYLDGVLAASVTVTGGGLLDAADFFDVASDSAGTGGGTGLIVDDLRFYDSAIDVAQIAHDMATPVS